MTTSVSLKVDIAVYDFDNTVYNGNSLLDFWKYALVRYPYLLLWVPFQFCTMLLWKCRIIDTGRFKEAFLSFIQVMPSSSFKHCIDAFWDRNARKIPSWVPEQIMQDRKENLVPFCVSASPDFLLEGITNKLGFDTLLCSEFLKRGSVQTNKMKVPNCKGHEKVRRLKEWAANNSLSFVVQKVYADSLTDFPLYQTANEHYHVKRGILRAGMPTL